MAARPDLSVSNSDSTETEMRMCFGVENNTHTGCPVSVCGTVKGLFTTYNIKKCNLQNSHHNGP